MAFVLIPGYLWDHENLVVQRQGWVEHKVRTVISGYIVWRRKERPPPRRRVAHVQAHILVEDEAIAVVEDGVPRPGSVGHGGEGAVDLGTSAPWSCKQVWDAMVAVVAEDASHGVRQDLRLRQTDGAGDGGGGHRPAKGPGSSKDSR